MLIQGEAGHLEEELGLHIEHLPIWKAKAKAPVRAP
jgi:hypothetical protein